MWWAVRSSGNGKLIRGLADLFLLCRQWNIAEIIDLSHLGSMEYYTLPKKETFHFYLFPRISDPDPRSCWFHWPRLFSKINATSEKLLFFGKSLIGMWVVLGW